MGLKDRIPSFVWRLRHRLMMLKYRGASVEEIFSSIYAVGAWGRRTDGAFCSGAGTTSSDASRYVDACVNFIRQHDVKSVLDIGCGDFSIMSEVVKATDVRFVGIDVAGNVIDYNIKNHANEKIQFERRNAITDEIPEADLITIRQVLQHLSNSQIETILKRALARSRYLMVTEHLPVGPQSRANLDKAAGPDIRLYRDSGVFLDRPPFNLKLSDPLLEYAEDLPVYGRLKRAIMRTSVIEGALGSEKR